jgi:hypothetical protein
MIRDWIDGCLSRLCADPLVLVVTKMQLAPQIASS